MNHTLNGLIRWEEILWSETKIFITNTTKSKDITQKIVGPCTITLGS